MGGAGTNMTADLLLPSDTGVIFSHVFQGEHLPPILVANQVLAPQLLFAKV